MLEIDRNGADIFKYLDELYARAQPDVLRLERTAYSNANLALAMLSDQAGQWEAGRRYMGRAITAAPRLIGSPAVVRRYAKLLMGPRVETVKLAWAATDRRTRTKGR